MEFVQHLDAIRDDSARFAASLATVPLDASVPPCPAWTGRDLLGHLTMVYDFWGTVVAEQRRTIDDIVRPDAMPDGDPFPRFEEQRARLIDVLTAADPAEPVWTWSGDNTVGFIIRRMAHETAVHRWDAQATAGERGIIDSELASDGIDELLFAFLPFFDAKAGDVGGSVHIHCGDVPGEWTIRVGDNGFVVAPEHAKGDCALRGAASDLLLALWKRVGLDEIDVVGDRAVAERFLLATTPPEES